MAKAAERLAKLEEQRARINAEIQRVKAREQQQKRKEETRRKVLVGAWMIKLWRPEERVYVALNLNINENILSTENLYFIFIYFIWL